jgi:hypothetical protein
MQHTSGDSGFFRISLASHVERTHEGLASERLCSAAETHELAAYLLNTPVAAVALALMRGELRASRADLVGTEALGATRTIFGNLGECFASVEAKRDKFLVREIREVLHRDACRAASDRDALDRLVAAERKGELQDRRMTLLVDSGGAMFVDGNKRAAAIFEVASPSHNLVLPVFVLRPNG